MSKVKFIEPPSIVLCECCDYEPAVGKHKDFNIANYCESCNLTRCDAFPMDCAIMQKIGTDPAFPLIMQLCEAEQVILRPDTLYKFVVTSSCKRCAELKAAYNV